MAKHYLSKTSNNPVAYLNGRVYTVDKSQPLASGFILPTAGTCEVVGTTDEILSIAKVRGLVTYDLRQQFIMPDMYDEHTHLLSAGEKRQLQTDIGGETNEHSLRITLKDRHCLYKFSKVKYLGEQFPDTPVLVRDTSLHKVLLNTEGLKRIGVIPEAERTVPPPGGVDVRRVDGMMTEELMEAGPGDVWLKLPVWPLPRIKKSTIYGINSCHKFGIALIQEASANTVYLHGLRELEEENKLKLDINTHIMCGNKFFPCESLESLKSLLDVAEDFKSKHVDTRFVKFWLDGPQVEPGPTHCTLNGEGEPDPKIPFFMARPFLLMSPSTIQGK